MHTPLRPYIHIRKFSTIQPKPLTWLWQPRIPRGKITLLAGDPASGKTTLLLHLASLLSRAHPMPLVPPTLSTQHSELSTPAATLLLSPEDNLADTLRPKLDSLHADLSQINTLPELHSLSDPTHIIHPETNQPLSPLEYLEAAIESIPNLALLIIDPITYYLGLSDHLLHHPKKAQGLNPWARPRSTLQALSALAEKHNLAIILTTRLAKKLPEKNATLLSLRRSLGSLAFTSTPRSVLLLLPNPTPQNLPAVVPTPPSAFPSPTLPPSTLNPSPSKADGDENQNSNFPSPPSALSTKHSALLPPPSHLLITIKSNLVEPPPPLAFTLTDQIHWHPTPVSLPADDPQSKKPTQRELNENTIVADAVEFLQKYLADGPQKVSTVSGHASELGISVSSLRRARIHLQITSQYSQYRTAWYYSLPGDARTIPTQEEQMEKEMRIFEQSRKNLLKTKQKLRL